MVLTLFVPPHQPKGIFDCKACQLSCNATELDVPPNAAHLIAEYAVAVLKVKTRNELR